MSRSLNDYRHLLDKVSAKFDEIKQRNPQHFSCGSGCHSCCVPDLSVFQIEFDHIVNALSLQPELEKKVQELADGKNFSSHRCSLLDRAGNCSIYEVRPLICRSHGAPIFSKMSTAKDAKPVLDVCPLNFSNIEKLTALPANDFINIDILNQLLVLLNNQHAEEVDVAKGQRFVLSPESLLNATDSKKSISPGHGGQSD